MSDKTVLYIEDNMHNRRIVSKILKGSGFNVIEAEDGVEGYSKIKELEPPLVLLDMALPGMDGVEIVSKAKADPKLKDIPVIAITASVMEGDRERFLDAGCDDYLPKPIQAKELIKMVEEHYPKS